MTLAGMRAVFAEPCRRLGIATASFFPSSNPHSRAPAHRDSRLCSRVVVGKGRRPGVHPKFGSHRPIVFGDEQFPAVAVFTFGALLISDDEQKALVCHTKPEVINCSTFELVILTFWSKWCVPRFALASSAQFC